MPGLTLDLVGDGELRGDLERQTRSLGLDDRVRFHGYVSRDRLAEMMRDADLHLLPSLRESQPHVVAEALATGMPTVATDAGGTAEMLEEGGGVVVPPADPQAFADALSTSARGSTRSTGTTLAARARERYGPEASTRMWTEIYTQPPGAAVTRAFAALRGLTNASTARSAGSRRARSGHGTTSG